ncbi:MAG TPA: hypothetical protein PLG34_07680 [Spirochaetota bacterium]|jgi:uncharacterized protein YxjI|nr:MAG: hypothetical protein BWX91_01984 [Spirochaetes bacterium ADurb.Bin133]HNZ25922.1 hypothetical protein [Spirochaetota bacterium]HPY87847.1 hypothetical protein [Spirochaetota bacterium]
MLSYPLNFTFKIVAFNPQVSVSDSAGNEVFYVKQKALALKESIKVFSDKSQSNVLFNINANKIIDFSAQYNITLPQGDAVGSLKRQGMKSIWKADYRIFNPSGEQIGVIKEENPWLKVLDSFLSGIPFLSMLVNPSYIIEENGKAVFRLKKRPAVFEGKFVLEKIGEATDANESLLIQSVIMAMLLERLRG